RRRLRARGVGRHLEMQEAREHEARAAGAERELAGDLVGIDGRLPAGAVRGRIQRNVADTLAEDVELPRLDLERGGKPLAARRGGVGDDAPPAVAVERLDAARDQQAVAL